MRRRLCGTAGQTNRLVVSFFELALAVGDIRDGFLSYGAQSAGLGSISLFVSQSSWVAIGIVAALARDPRTLLAYRVVPLG